MDADKVKRMLQCFCTIEDVCKANNISAAEFDAFCQSAFSMAAEDAAEVFAAQGRAMVHTAQVDAALDGNNSMLLLLGKQYLGQTDEPERETAKKEDTPLDNVIKLYAGAKDRKTRAAR